MYEKVTNEKHSCLFCLKQWYANWTAISECPSNLRYKAILIHDGHFCLAYVYLVHLKKKKKRSIYKEVQWSLETQHLIFNSAGKSTNCIITYSATFNKVIYLFILKTQGVWVIANKPYFENLRWCYTKKIRCRAAWKKALTMKLNLWDMPLC